MADEGGEFFKGDDEDVVRIKEEWERLHREGAEERRRRIQEEVEKQKSTWEKSADDTMKEDRKKHLPPARLQSIGSMDGRTPAASDNSAAFGKKLPALGSLGQRLGIMVDAGELEPAQVKLERTNYRFGKDTPTQTEIKWSPPSNANKFHAITYNIEVDGGQGWMAVNDSRQTLFRVYFTSEKIIVGRYQRAQEEEPVAVRLHVRATGTLKVQGQEENISGPWSDDIWLTLAGSCITETTAV